MEWQFGYIPQISQAVTDDMRQEMAEFGKLSDEAKREAANRVVQGLSDANPELAAAVLGITEGVMNSMWDSLAYKLSHAEWVDLLFRMRHGQLIISRVINEALREKQG